MPQHHAAPGPLARRLRHLAAGSLLVVLAANHAPTAHAQERRIATLAPEGSLWMKTLRKGAALVETATDGRVTTKYYGGGSMGDERAVVRKMRVGQLDGAALTAVGLAMIYPGIRVLQLPYFYDSVQELDYVRAKLWPHLQVKFRAQGFELLSAGDVGWIYLFSTRPVRSAADLRKLKIWRWQSDPQANRLFERLGLNGVPLGVPEVLAALSTGRIQAAFGSPLAAVALQWHTHIKCMASSPVGYGIGGMVMRTDSWQQASPADITAQRTIGRKLSKRSLRRVRKDNQRALTAMTRQGITVIPTPAEVEQRFRTEAEHSWGDGVGTLYTQQELDMALSYRAEFRRKHPDAPKQRGLTLH